MKLTVLLLTLAIAQAHGAGLAQNVTISGHNLSLKQVFTSIKRQTGYAFFYNNTLLEQAHLVTLDVKDEPLFQVIDRCFRDQPLTYYIENKTVVITQRPPADRIPAMPADSIRQQPIAADIVIKGKITNEKGEPLAGASVHTKDTRFGTSTDADGSFILRVPAGSVLIISSVGYETRRITVTKPETLVIQLTFSNRSIDEVVVTGYGENRVKRSLGYAVTQISGDDIRATAQVNPISALQGMVAGLQVQPGVAGEASTPNIKLRGSNSLNAYENTPLIVVDGMIFDNQSVTPNPGNYTDYGNILKDLNPDDIESISVLKGGAVTALYGSRAANGVLLIKTKKGLAQKGLGISVSQDVLFDQAYKTTDFQNVYGAGLYANDWSTLPNGGLAINASDYGISFGPKMTGQTFQDINGLTRKNYPNTRDLLDIYRTGQTSNTNIALSGGNENSTFRMSYSRLGSNTVLPNNSFDRNSFALRATHRIGSNMTLDGNVTYVHSYNHNPAQQDGSSPMYKFFYQGARNYDAGYWSHHYIDSVVGGVNNADITGISQTIFFPLYQDQFFQKENNLRAGIDLTAKILSWLTFNGNASINLYDRDQETDERGSQPGFNNPYYAQHITNLLQARYRGELAGSKQYGDYRFDLHIGGEVFTSGQTGILYYTNGGVLPDIYRLSNSANPVTTVEDKPNKSQLSSAYFQGSVGYKNFLTLNIYGRNDWNSSLVYNDGHGQYSYFYGGADVAFVFTDLFKNRPSWLDFGKLRLSYASAGNGSDPYTANTGSYGSLGTYTGGSSNVSQYAYQSSTLGNQDLVPERSSKIETGLEFRLFKGRLGGDFTFYNQDTKNQIINFSVPSTSGVSAALLNGGLVRDRGIEVMVYGTPVQSRHFSWTSRFIYYYNRNTVVSLPFGTNYINLYGEDGITSVAVRNGNYGELVAPYGYARYNGGNGSPLNGQHVLGMTGNGTQAYYIRAVNYGTDPLSQEPQIGSTLPKFLGSWMNTFSYKGLSLGIFLDARIGGLEWSTSYFYGSQTGNIKSTLYGRDAAHGGLIYTPTNPTSQYLGFPLGTTQRDDGIALKGVFESGSRSVGTDGNTHDVSGMTFDQALKDGYVTPVNAADYYVKTFSWSAGIREAGVFENSWVALRQVSLGYEIPPSLIHKLKLNNLRVSLVGRNLIYLYNSAHDHINPENENDSGSGSAFEDGGVPYVRSYGFMFNTSF
jgi:iron complex outermembrane receptor protein